MNNSISKYSFSDKKSLIEKISEFGLAIFRSKSSEYDFKKIIESIGNIYQHRDSEIDGYTYIKDKGLNIDGHKGFSSGYLRLHTDRSCIGTPPSLLAVYFKKQSEFGGESNFVDIYTVYNYLQKKHPSVLNMLMNTKCIFFDKKNKIEQPILAVDEDIIKVRYRNDDLISFPRCLETSIFVWEECIDKFQFSFNLNSNNYYVLDNRRMLHGRNSFKGSREIIRALLI